MILSINNNCFHSEHSHDWLKFVNEMECVFFWVKTVSLNIWDEILTSES
jgi:hypothetical protein